MGVEYDADNLQIFSQVNAWEWDSQSNSKWEGFCCHFNVNVLDYDTIIYMIYNSTPDLHDLHHTVDYFLSQPHNVLFLAYSVYTPCIIKENIYYAFLILDFSHVLRSNWESAVLHAFKLSNSFLTAYLFSVCFFPLFYFCSVSITPSHHYFQWSPR